MCRVYRAEVMRLRGDWATAQDDGQLACAELREWSPAVAGAAFYELGEIRLRTGDVDGAEAAAAELREVADRYDSTALSAAAASAAGAVALARGDTATAVGSFRAALQAWRLADVPYEGARTRVLLAQAYLRGGDRAAATLELDSAKAVFVRLGAAPDVRRIAELESDGGGQEAHRCFLFTDIVDSTTLAGALGDEAWTGLLG